MLRVLKHKGLRKSILFTIFILMVFIEGTYIPTPGLNSATVFSGNALDNLLLMNRYFGGSLSQLSLFALGVSPYITSTIIIQLLSYSVFKKWKEYNKQGQVGRKKLQKITTILTLVISIVQASLLTFGLDSYLLSSLVEDKSFENYALIIATFVVGSMVVCWLAQQISDFGVGNGVSVIIATSIVTLLPNQLLSLYNTLLGADSNLGVIYLVVGIILIVVALSLVWIVEGLYFNISVAQMNSFVSTSFDEERYLPIKLNLAGVMPVIISTTLITVTQLVISSMNGLFDTTYVLSFFNTYSYRGIALFGALVFLLSLFYSKLQFNTKDVAHSLQLRGNYIVGVRPGADTIAFLNKRVRLASVLGAVYLSSVTVLPLLLTRVIGLNFSIGLMGTSAIILVGVYKEISSQISGALLRNSVFSF